MRAGGFVLAFVVATAAAQECCDPHHTQYAAEEREQLKLAETCKERGGIPILERRGGDDWTDMDGHAFKKLVRCEFPPTITIKGEK